MIHIENTPLSLEIKKDQIICYIHGGHVLFSFKRNKFGWVDESTTYIREHISLDQVFDDIEEYIYETNNEEDYIIAKDSLENIKNNVGDL